MLVHSAALAPLLVLAAQTAAGMLPITIERHLMLWSGMISLVLLLASFACTPLTAATGWRGWMQVRRPLGVYGFCYALAHLLVYAMYDGGLDPGLIWRDLGERRAMAIGLVALLLLVPLAVTSTDGWQRRLGARWRTLHRLVYAAVPLSVLHYLWLERDVIIGAQIATVVVGVLFILRLPALRRRLARLRQAESGRRRQRPTP
jgi:sulfoxide reductase heme-binding subunit YedZ